jgi:hypothetical protein
MLIKICMVFVNRDLFVILAAVGVGVTVERNWEMVCFVSFFL